MFIEIFYLNLLDYPEILWYDKYLATHFPKNLFYIDELTCIFGFLLLFFNLLIKFGMFELLWITHLFNKKHKNNFFKSFLGDSEHRFEKLFNKKPKERFMNVQMFCWNSLIIHEWFKIKMFGVLKSFFFNFFPTRSSHSSKKPLSYKSYSKLFKILKKISQPNHPKLIIKNIYFFWWFLHIFKNFLELPNYLAFFTLMNFSMWGFDVKITKKFKRNTNLKKKIKFFFHKKFSAKPFFVRNVFLELQFFFWPIRNKVVELCWTKSIIPLKKHIKGFFLRKTKIFYKGRYARNRQTCRVIVYWTIAFNLIWIYSLYFFFYQISFNFGYIWWGLLAFHMSLVWSSFIKYSFYNPKNILSEFIQFFKWIFYLVRSIFY